MRRSLRWSWIGLLLASCVGDDPTTTDVSDGGTDDAAGSDTGAADSSTVDSPEDPDAGPACDRSKAFGTPIPTTNVNSAFDELSARLSGDGLTIYLSSNRNVAGAVLFDLYKATRSAGQPFSTPQRIPQAGGGSIGFGGNQQSPTVIADGTTLYYADDESGQSRIFVSTRANEQTDFGAPGLWAPSTGPTDTSPYVLPSGDVLYFASDRNGGLRTFRITRVSGIWGTSQEQMTYGTTNVALSPVVTADELTIYFAGRPAATGSIDIYTAKRTNKADPFPTPTRVDELSDAISSDAPAYLTSDQCTIYIATNRSGGLGNQEIWQATRPK